MTEKQAQRIIELLEEIASNTSQLTDQMVDQYDLLSEMSGAIDAMSGEGETETKKDE